MGDLIRDREALGGLAKSVRINIRGLRQNGADERACDAIDRDVNELHRLGDRFAEEAQAYKESESRQAIEAATQDAFLEFSGQTNEYLAYRDSLKASA